MNIIIVQGKSGELEKEYILKVSYNLKTWNLNKNLSQILNLQNLLKNTKIPKQEKNYDKIINYNINEDNILQFFDLICEIKNLNEFKTIRAFLNFDNYYEDNECKLL